MIQNPILRGFNPDASIIRVEDDYYIATSTFEWFPGVLIHHSKDLMNWRPLTRPLDRVSQLDLRGVPSSGGIWAPSLSYDNGTYYLCFTNVVGRKGVYKDLHNYIVTAPSIEGPWSDPIYLNSSGEGKLIGKIKLITQGTDLGVTEGPMVYKKDGFYYLLVAEGGTGPMHAATLMRATSVDGPYEVDPDYPIITTRNTPEHPLQNAGHGSLVETQFGDWYIALTVKRGRRSVRRCTPAILPIATSANYPLLALSLGFAHRICEELACMRTSTSLITWSWMVRLES